VKPIPSFFFSLIILVSCASAEKIIYLAKGKIYAHDLERQLEEVIAELSPPERINSLLVLSRTKQIIYSVQSRDRKGAVLWQSRQEGGSAKQLLESDFFNLELCDFSPDEKRIVFQGMRNDSSVVTYLNLESGKMIQLDGASSPRFFSNTKLIVLTSPGWPVGWYQLLARWDVAKQTLDTLFYSEDICNRVVNLSKRKDRLAVIRSTAGSGLNEYIDIVDPAGQVIIPRAGTSSGLIQILGGPDFSPDGRYLTWVHEHWLKLTNLQTKETKKIAERLLTDETAWSPYGGELALAFAPPRNFKECSTCPKIALKRAPGIFIVNLAGDSFQRVAYPSQVGQIFWTE
jgi:hypothetical protein